MTVERRKLLVRYPLRRPVLLDGEPVGLTNEVLRVEVGKHLLEVDDPAGTEPMQRVVLMRAQHHKTRELAFRQSTEPLQRFSPLYSLYNGFMLGQFLALAFADWASNGQQARRERILDFLDEIEIRIDLPPYPQQLAGSEHLKLISKILSQLQARSTELADFARLGVYIVLVSFRRSTSAQIVSDLDALLEEYSLPPIPYRTLVPELDAEETLSVDEAVSAGLAYLRQIVQLLPVERYTAFVVMPFSPPYSGYFSCFYRKALEAAGYRAFRAWGGMADEEYCDLLLSLISKCGFVLGDVSSSNYNVFYEMGAAHALDKSSLLLVDESFDSALPANIGRDSKVIYSTTEPDWPEVSVRDVASILVGLRLAREEQPGARVSARKLATTLHALGESAQEKLAPTEALKAKERAILALKRDDHATAESEITAAIERGLTGENSYALRALIRLGSDDAGAERDLTHALELAPDRIDLVRMRGLARAQLDDDSGAERDLTHVLDAKPEDAEAWSYRGIVRAAMGKYLEAEMDFAQANARGYSSDQMDREWKRMRKLVKRAQTQVVAER